MDGFVVGLIDIEIARQHCRSESEDDVMLQIYLSAAEQKAQDELNRRVFVDATALDTAISNDEAGANPIVINDAIKSAILLMCGHLYANREEVATSVSATQIPMGFFELLKPHMIFAGTDNG